MHWRTREDSVSREEGIGSLSLKKKGQGEVNRVLSCRSEGSVSPGEAYQDGVNDGITHNKWLHFEGFAECGCLVHSPHGGRFVSIDILA